MNISKTLLTLVASVTFLSAYASNNPYCCKQEIISELSLNFNTSNTEKLRQVYTKKEFQRLWDRQSLTSLLEALNNPLLNYQHLDFHQQELHSLMEILETSEDPTTLARTDLLATNAFLRLAKFIYEGEININKFQKEIQTYEEKDLVWEYNKPKMDYASLLEKALSSYSIAQTLNSLAPKAPQYKKLVAAYQRYERIINNGGFPKVTYYQDMKLSDYGDGASELKKFLFATGDLRNVSRSYLEFPRFDEILEEALRKYQARHYMPTTGVLDKVVVMYTRKDPKEKLSLIKLNIERHKLFKNINDHEYIEVNIPEFSLKYYQANTLLHDIFVVIGREDRPTPIFNDELEYIVLNPTWSVPPKLLKKDYLPQLVEDPHSLDGHFNIMQGEKQIDPSTVNWSKFLPEDQKVPYSFIQPAGVENVLGQMKFIFPNKYNVYLHDTDAKSLTTTKYRLYSSGCIRLAKPYELLSLIAPYTPYSFDQLISLIEKKETQYVRLSKHIPIYIRYFTAFVDKDANVNFRRDFYEIDAFQKAASKSFDDISF